MRAKLIALFTKQHKPIGIMFIFIFTILCFFYTLHQEDAISKVRSRLASNQKVLVDAHQSILIKELDNILENLNFLYESPNFQTYLNENKNQNIVEDEWAAFATNMKHYDQLRYLDLKGNERIRVDFKNGKAWKITSTDLQNKNDRYYFKDAIKLNSGDVFVSKFDLNVEHNVIELPIKPILRVALPVFDSNKIKRGIIISNYLATFMLEDIKIANRNDKYVHLVNSDGYWLAAPDSEKEWAFMYPDRNNISFKNEYPKEWELITTQKNGQFFTPNGLFTIRTIYPTEKIFASENNHNTELNYNDQNSTLFLIMQVPASEDPYINDTNSYFLAMLTLVKSLPLILGMITLSLFIAILFGMHIDENEKIKFLATRDTLTGCLNRREGRNIIEVEILRSERYNVPISLIMLDLDHFKKVNDTWGHPVGDQVIKLIAKQTYKNIRTTDSFIRLGGEEFIIFAPETPLANAAILAEKIRKILEETAHPSVGKVTVSLGVAEHIPSESFTQWYERADSALYEAKNTGRNRVVIAKNSLTQKADHTK